MKKIIIFLCILFLLSCDSNDNEPYKDDLIGFWRLEDECTQLCYDELEIGESIEPRCTYASEDQYTYIQLFESGYFETCTYQKDYEDIGTIYCTTDPQFWQLNKNYIEFCTGTLNLECLEGIFEFSDENQTLTIRSSNICSDGSESYIEKIFKNFNTDTIDNNS